MLDDVRDLSFLVRHQHVFQAKYQKMTEFGHTPGGVCSYSLYLYKTPFIITANFSTKNLHLLDTDDFLSKHDNCRVYRLTESPFEEREAAEASVPELAAAPAPTAATLMGSWSVSATAHWLEKKDLLAAADAARNNGFCGADLLEAEENMLVTDLRLTPFLARKIIKARDDFLGES